MACFKTRKDVRCLEHFQQLNIRVSTDSIISRYASPECGRSRSAKRLSTKGKAHEAVTVSTEVIVLQRLLCDQVRVLADLVHRAAE